jgi:Ca2+-binding EF-hand superfamily protein
MKNFVVFMISFFLTSVAIAQDRVAKYDLNKDSAVDYDELFAVCDLRKTLFDKADKNQDGVLSNSEMRQGKAYLFADCKKKEKKEA